MFDEGYFTERFTQMQISRHLILGKPISLETKFPWNFNFLGNIRNWKFEPHFQPPLWFVPWIVTHECYKTKKILQSWWSWYSPHRSVLWFVNPPQRKVGCQIFHELLDTLYIFIYIYIYSPKIKCLNEPFTCIVPPQVKRCFIQIMIWKQMTHQEFAECGNWSMHWKSHFEHWQSQQQRVCVGRRKSLWGIA